MNRVEIYELFEEYVILFGRINSNLALGVLPHDY
jgi:hypothetical protein